MPPPQKRALSFAVAAGLLVGACFLFFGVSQQTISPNVLGASAKAVAHKKQDAERNLTRPLAEKPLALMPPSSLVSKLGRLPLTVIPNNVTSGSPLMGNGLPAEVRKGRILEQRESVASAIGQKRRATVYETTFKYPFLRVEEMLGRDAATGKEQTLTRSVMVADHVLVRLQNGAQEAQLLSHVASLGLSIRRHLPNSALYLIAFPNHSVAEFDRVMTAFEQSPGPTVYAEPDFIAQASVDPLIPNDPSFASQWALHNTGQSGGVSGADIKAPEAWNTTTGNSDIVVAVIDTGVDYTHPDLAANIWSNPGETAGDGIDDDHDGYIDDVRGWNFYAGTNDPMDDHGHGSHTSGILGAVGGNAKGISGVTQHVKIMPLKFLSADGSGSDSDAIEAIHFATAHHAILSSNSWGGSDFTQSMLDAIQEANTAGVGFIAAAGNAGSNNDSIPSYPASFQSDNVIAVAATNASDVLSNFSNFGKTTVHIAAPGEDIYSTYKNAGYTTMSGTSMATPHVAGAAALLKAANPSLTFAQIKQSILTQTDALPSLKDKSISGGRLNVNKALVPATGPFVTLTDITIDDAAGGNGDGILSPGEAASVLIKLTNIGAFDATDLQATLALKAADPLITLTQATANYGTIPPNGNTTNTLTPFALTIDPLKTTPSDVPLTLTVTDSASHTWTLDVTLHIYTISTLSGLVTKVTGGDPIEGATLEIKGPVNTTTTTLADGTYSIPLVNGTYSVVAKATNLNPSEPQSVTLPPSKANVNFALGYSTLQISATSLTSTQYEDDIKTQTFTITNNGDLPLTYRIQEVPHNNNTATSKPAAASWAQNKALLAKPVRSPMEGIGLLKAPSIHASDVTLIPPHEIPFFDGFEKGNWTDNWYATYGADNTREVVTSQAARGTHSLHIRNNGPDDGHFTGVHTEFDYNISPGYVGFWVRPGARDLASSYVVLTDVYWFWLFDWAWFFASNNGRFYINDDVGGNQSFIYQENQWYHVELRNIDWTAKAFDYYVNGTLIQSGVPMRNPDYVGGLAYPILYNYSTDVDAWWDDFQVSADALNWLGLSSKQGTIAPGGSTTITVTFNATDIVPGTTTGDLSILTNAALEPNATIPLTMNVEMPAVTFDSTGTGPISVFFNTPSPTAQVYFTADNSTPSLSNPSVMSGRSLQIQRTTTLKACAIMHGFVGPVAQHTFTITDTNGQGLPDWWQMAHFGELGIDPQGDADGDGRSNWIEFVTGTDPNSVDNFEAALAINTNATSGVTVSSVVIGPTVTWPSVQGRIYTVESSTDMITWNNASDPLNGTGNAMSYQDSNISGVARRFYRVRVALP